jgi:aminoglycoside phosphotransferase (APT) family kinase protein
MSDEPRDTDSSGTYFISIAEFEGRKRSREDALLDALRRAWDAPQLQWNGTPHEFARGAESTVLELTLDNTPTHLNAPLVARLLEVHDPDQLAREFALQGALEEIGFPVPRPFARGPGEPGVLKPFLVMERIGGRTLFSLIGWVAIGSIALSLLGWGFLGAVLALGWFALSVRLQLRLHALPVEPIEQAIARCGIDPGQFRTAACIERLAGKSAAMRLDSLAPAVDWLRSHRPGGGGDVVCHGDYWPGNVLVSHRGVTGLIDWANGAIAPREFDLAWNRVQHASGLPGVERIPAPWRGWIERTLQPLVWLFLLPHRWLYRCFRRLDGPLLDFFVAFHCVRIWIWAQERECGDPGAENPWNTPQARQAVSGLFERVTGFPIATEES